jgi:hypothetical protein
LGEDEITEAIKAVVATITDATSPDVNLDLYSTVMDSTYWIQHKGCDSGYEPTLRQQGHGNGFV